DECCGARIFCPASLRLDIIHRFAWRAPMGFRRPVKPIRTVLRWQAIVTAALTLVAALVWGLDGAISAALGGAVNIVAGWVYGWRGAQGEARTAGVALRTMLRAEGIKVLVIIAGLGLVLTNYRDIVHV